MPYDTTDWIFFGLIMGAFLILMGLVIALSIRNDMLRQENSSLKSFINTSLPGSIYYSPETRRRLVLWGKDSDC